MKGYRGVLRGGLTLLLMGAIVSSALSAVYGSQQSRHLFSELEGLRQAQNQLDAEWGMLTLERSTLLSHANVERQAADRLSMGLPEPERIVVVRQ